MAKTENITANASPDRHANRQNAAVIGWAAAVVNTQQAASSPQPAFRPVSPGTPGGQVIRPNVPQWGAPVAAEAEATLTSRAWGLAGKTLGAIGTYFAMTGPAGTPPVEGTLPGGMTYRYVADEGSLSIGDGDGRFVSARPHRDGTFRTENGEIVARHDPSGKGLQFDSGYLSKLQSRASASGQPDWAKKTNPQTGAAYKSEADYNRKPFRPNQQCTNSRLDELEAAKDDACTKQGAWKCSNTIEKLGRKKEKLLTCNELDARAKIGQGCLDARNKIQDECFDGKPDERHAGQNLDVERAIKTCRDKYIERCTPGS